jgi:hypothetical protein
MQLALLSAVLAPACAGTPPARSQTASPADGLSGLARIESELRGVDTSNGVDANEAEVIAGIYFGMHISGCGAIDEVVLHDRIWVASLLIGAGGSAMDETVDVDARSGGVSSSLGPRYPDFATFRQRVLSGANGTTP